MSEGSPTAAEAEQISAEEALRLVLIDQSHDAHDEARDTADARLDKELSEGGRFKKFVNGIWKGNIAKDYYRQKYVSQALEIIEERNNVLANSPAERRTRALESTIQRFQSDYEEVIHTEAGEKREVQAEDNQLSQGMKHIIREFVEGNLNATTLHEERTRLLNEYRKEHGEESLGKGIVTTDNLLEIAQAVVGIVEHGESLDNALGKLQVITGEARNGARTEARYTAVDKGIDWLSKRKITSIVTPGTLAVGVAAAASIARVGSHSVVGAVTKTLIPGAAAGLWAGLRENRRTKDERSQHAREMAVGGNFAESDKRRVEMDKTRYESIPATNLIRHLQEVGDEEKLASGSEAVQAALDALAAIQSRIQLSDSKNIDLISYSGKAEVGEERMMLDLARHEVRLALESRLTENVRTELSIAQDKDLKDILQERADVFAGVLRDGTEDEEGMDAKDKAFAQLKRHRVAKAAAIGVATGVIGGLVVQEGVAAIDPTRFGLLDMIRGDVATPNGDGAVHQTILEGMFRGDATTVHTGPSSTFDTYPTGTDGHGNIELSDDHTLSTNPDGTMNLVDKNGNTDIQGLTVDADGKFDQASLDKLDQAGMHVADKSFDQTITSTTTQEVSASQYIDNHMADTTKVTRDLWYANDTPNVYDHNELGIHRGGDASAPGIVAGGYQYNISGMSPEGSYEGGDSVDWNQAATNGNLFVAISGTEDAQGNPFMVPIDPDGTVNISADSPAGHFFANENNAVAFKGAYMEIVQSTGQDPDGTVHIRPLSTLVGEGTQGPIMDTVPTETIEHHADYVITTNGFDTVQSNFTEMAPITPVASRRSMETLHSEEREGDYGYNRPPSELERRQWLKEMSPRLLDNPDAVLNPKQELAWYREELIKRHGQNYVSDMEAFVQNNPELQRINDNSESIVTIPVAAVSEADTIYGTLSTFAQQEAESQSKNTILLNLNWLDSAMDDPSKVATIQKTTSEIERARRDFPGLNIAVMQHEYSFAETNPTGGAVGYAVEDLINASLLAVNTKIQAGEIDGAHDMVIIRSDADVNGLSRTQLKNLQKAIRENSELDVVKGATRFGVSEQTKFPGWGIASNFSTALSIADTQQNHIHTGGANFGVRASTFAAIGGLGDMLEGKEALGRWTGAGSDDVLIGKRISYARGIDTEPRSSQTYYSRPVLSQSNRKVRRVKLVSGAALDTNPARLIPYYVAGRSFQEAWERGGSFASGLDRNADAALVRNAAKEVFEGRDAFKALEVTLTKELSFSNRESARRALAMFFADTPGAYRITGEIGKENVQFKLTAAGRAFIKNRVERETNGQFGSYGTRKNRQLYGITKPGAKRQPASSISPLVSPLT